MPDRPGQPFLLWTVRGWHGVVRGRWRSAAVRAPGRGHQSSFRS